MKRILFTFLFSGFALITILAQQGQVNGLVKDSKTGETLIGANILAGQGRGTVSDENGKFSLLLDYGKYNIRVSYVGFQTRVKEIVVSGKPVYLKDRKSVV